MMSNPSQGCFSDSAPRKLKADPKQLAILKRAQRTAKRLAKKQIAKAVKESKRQTDESNI